MLEWYTVPLVTFPRPDVLRSFVTIGNAETVHEVDPRRNWRSWSAFTLCGRPVHETGRVAPRQVNATTASCNRCRAKAMGAIVACAIVRWGEALAVRSSPR